MSHPVPISLSIGYSIVIVAVIGCALVTPAFHKEFKIFLSVLFSQVSVWSLLFRWLGFLVTEIISIWDFYFYYSYLTNVCFNGFFVILSYLFPHYNSMIKNFFVLVSTLVKALHFEQTNVCLLIHQSIQWTEHWTNLTDNLFKLYWSVFCIVNRKYISCIGILFTIILLMFTCINNLNTVTSSFLFSFELKITDYCCMLE